MVNLDSFEKYFLGLRKHIPEVKMVKFVTSETEMSEWLGDVTNEQQPFLMVLIPTAKSSGSRMDAIMERNYCLFYLLRKIDRQTMRPFNVQKELQPLVERIKQQIIKDKGSCEMMNGLEVGSFHTDPENMISSRTSGWSVSFELEVWNDD